MRKIAILGAGQAGLQLAIGLLKHGYEVTLISNHTSKHILQGSILSSQAMFHTALNYERDLGIHFWENDCPKNTSVTFALSNNETIPATKALHWKGILDNPFQSVDQRLKFSVWQDHFEELGGNLVIKEAQVDDLEELSTTHDLVVVSTGKGRLGELFPKNKQLSVFDEPMRTLACFYVKGMKHDDHDPGVHVNEIPGVGEYFTLPGLTIGGRCEMMLFEGIFCREFDCWNDLTSPEDMLEKATALLQQFIPWEAERCNSIQLADSNAVLKGYYTPIVRNPVCKLLSNKTLLGMADAVVLNDPVAGQGANNASKCAKIYMDSIISNEDRPFDENWMINTFNKYWKYAEWATKWSNILLAPPEPHVEMLLGAASQNQRLANLIANAFNNPSTLFPWILCEKDTRSVIAACEKDKMQFV